MAALATLLIQRHQTPWACLGLFWESARMQLHPSSTHLHAPSPLPPRYSVGPSHSETASSLGSWRMMCVRHQQSLLPPTFRVSIGCGMTQRNTGVVTPVCTSKGSRLLLSIGRMSIVRNQDLRGNRVNGKEQRTNGLNGRFLSFFFPLAPLSS